MLDYNLISGAEEPINLLEYEIVVQLVHFEGVGVEIIRLAVWRVDETLNGRLEGIVLKMFWGFNGRPFVELDIPVNVLPLDEIESELGNSWV